MILEIISARTAPHLAEAPAGLKMTAEPAAKAASAPPAGMAIGKFHGGVTTVTPNGTGLAPSILSSSSAR